MIANGDFVAGFREAVSELKRTDDDRELAGKRLPLGDGSGWLVPVCELHAENVDLIETLGQWRTRYMEVFPTQFTVTFAGTRSWLRQQVLDAPDRVMFLVVEGDGTIIGHCGFAEPSPEGVLKLDNILRGAKAKSPSTMHEALLALFAWARGLGAVGARAPVMDTNLNARRFYARLGSKVIGQRPLRRHVEGDRVVYRPLEAEDDAEPDRYHIETWRELVDPG